MNSEKKTKFALWIYPQTLKEIEHHFKNDNCHSKSEFIEKAVKFYIGYLNQKNNVDYLSPMITETVKAEIHGTEQRLSRLLFKIAVEMGKLSHMLAAMHDVDKETLHELHIMCVNEVRKINGIIHYENAVEFQHSD